MIKGNVIKMYQRQNLAPKPLCVLLCISGVVLMNSENEIGTCGATVALQWRYSGTQNK
jgi:hypothetical protein